MNNETLNKIARAMYQIFIVGILLLPYRLFTLVCGIANGFMIVCTGITFKDYYSAFFENIIEAYKARIKWVKYGTQNN